MGYESAPLPPAKVARRAMQECAIFNPNFERTQLRKAPEEGATFTGIEIDNGTVVSVLCSESAYTQIIHNLNVGWIKLAYCVPS